MNISSIKSFVLLFVLSCFVFFSPQTPDACAQKLNGAGATFPYPLYSQWAFRYNQITRLEINYQSIGSGGGIQQIKARTVDFGASDAPLTKEELDKSGLIQFPMVIGGVVPVVNLPGIKPGQLKLSPETLSGIYLGRIKMWNDPSIRAINPGLALPNRAIAVVHRADGSGTTWIFTNYLDKVSPEWKSKVGTDKAVSWPVGVAGKGNEGVAAYVQRIVGSIGYVEYAYALVNKMNHTLLLNSAGDFAAPAIESFQAAAANADWKNAPGFYMVLTNQSGKDSWPITGASFILLYKEQKNAAPAKALLGFFDWCFRHGESEARKLNYVPLPPALFNLVEEQWAKEIRSVGQQVWK
ncbi:MAG: phosphate ABC transporter substrate-binding protein PstS [Candidatus Latescibacter sp.]|nr:phosphate ABC transporter substrate-binding protein PstS [Candidatus Latescibacter sp.]